MRHRPLSDCLSAPAWSLHTKRRRWLDPNCQVPGGRLRSHQGSKWLGSGPLRCRRGGGGAGCDRSRYRTTDRAGRPRWRGALGLGFGLPPISRLLSLVKGPVLFPRLFFTTCETQRAVRNCCSINIFRWYRSVHINGIDPSPITFLIHSGQGKNNPSSLSASQQPFLSALALYCWQFHQFHIFFINGATLHNAPAVN